MMLSSLSKKNKGIIINESTFHFFLYFFSTTSNKIFACQKIKKKINFRKFLLKIRINSEKSLCYVLLLSEQNEL